MTACDPRTCPCVEAECTLSRYAKAATLGRNDERDPATDEPTVRQRPVGPQSDLSAMAAVQNLHRAANATRNHLERTVLAAHRLTWTGWVVLWVVWIWQEIETRHVADEAGISKGTLTGVVKTLQARGLLTRRAHPDDARRVLLELTPLGSELMTALLPAVNRHETELTSGLSADGTITLGRMLRAIVVDLD